MRTRKLQPDWRWPSWRYGPGGQSAIYQCEADVPEGWTRKPDEAPEVFMARPEPVRLDRAVLIDELHRYDIEINPTWGVAQMKKVLDDVHSTR